MASQIKTQRAWSPSALFGAISPSNRRVVVVSRDVPDLRSAVTAAIEDLRAVDPEGAWTYDRIAVEVTNLGTPLSSIYLRQIASGRKASVGAMLLVNLAAVLQKPLLYFTDPVVRAAVRRAIDEPSPENERVAAAIEQFRSMTPQEREAVLEGVAHQDQNDD